MGWLRLVGSLKLWVSFAKEPYKREDVLQKKPVILRSLLIVSICRWTCGTKTSNSEAQRTSSENKFFQAHALECMFQRVTECCGALQYVGGHVDQRPQNWREAARVTHTHTHAHTHTHTFRYVLCVCACVCIFVCVCVCLCVRQHHQRCVNAQ